MVRSSQVGYRGPAVELRHLSCFVAVSDEKSFAAAARRLHVVPSNVSQQIRQLERELGVELFERTTRHVRVTEAGRSLYPSAVRVLEEVDRLRSMARQHTAADEGALRGCFAPGTGDLVSALVGELAARYPGWSVAFEPMQSAEIVTTVASGARSVGICQLSSPPGSSLLLARHPQSFLAMPEDHPLAANKIVRPADLHGRDVIVIGPDTHAEFHQKLLSAFEEMGVEPRFRPFPITMPEQLMELVAARQGLALVDRRTMAHYPARGTVVRPLEGCLLHAEYYLIWPPGDPDPLVEQAVAVARELVPTFMEL